MPLNKEQLAELLKLGPVADIFHAERAYALLMTIGEHAAQINDSTSNFGELLGSIQGLAQVDVLLSVARLYDRPSGRNPTRCLETLLVDVEASGASLPGITDRQRLRQGLVQLGMTDCNADALIRQPDPAAGVAAAAFLRSLLSQPKVVGDLQLVRVVRDKRIAHNEDVRAPTGPTWRAILDLIDLAKAIVGLLGWAYLNTVYMHDDGTYTLTSDAERPARAMLRMLEALQIGGAPPPVK